MSEKDKRYLASCHRPFWSSVLEAETIFIANALRDHRKVLSAGCGPAIIESNLQFMGWDITCIDTSEEMISSIDGKVPATIMSAEAMDFPDSSFDAVLFCASLQFMNDYHAAIAESARVLRGNGLIIILLLNPRSNYFAARRNDHNSYISMLKHTDIHEIESIVTMRFDVGSEYFLGIDGENIFESSSPDSAAIYAIIGRRKL